MGCLWEEEGGRRREEGGTAMGWEPPTDRPHCEVRFGFGALKVCRMIRRAPLVLVLPPPEPAGLSPRARRAQPARPATASEWQWQVEQLSQAGSAAL